MTDRRPSQAERRDHARRLASLEEQEADFERFKLSQRLVPPGWHALEHTAPVTPRKTRINLELDADMLDWFRALGPGYQRHINAVLRAYMHAVLAKEVEQPGDRDWRGELI